MKTAMITGATSGIGEACARLLAQKGYRTIITGRRSKRLELLKEELEQHSQCLTLCFDVRSRKEVENAIDNLPAEWQSVDILINNAGLAAGLASIQDGNTDDWEQMIDTNIKGLLFITKKLIPLLKKSAAPHIVNIGSIAGKEVYANGNIYCATKFAVDALTKAMRIDLLADGFKVSQVAPGAAETEFSLVRFKGDDEKAAGVYKGYTPLLAADIANTVFWIISQPEHVNISDVVIMPKAQAGTYYWNKSL
jgi:3-hydroxy acid dehydrogenase / malonic semialdehyde reductase